VFFATLASAACPAGQAPAFPGSDTCILDPLSIPKYVTPLVIPPVMNDNGRNNKYDIAVRQFQQQILPGGIWNSLNGRNDDFPPTTVWGYGPDADPTPTVAPDPTSQFNYPAYTIETKTYRQVKVRWINELVDANGDCLPHLLPVDQTLHWANPVMDCRMGDPRTDCAGQNPAPYTGPVPLVTHLHGAHVESHSDGYPEAWWLPNCPQTAGLATSGTLFDDATGSNPGNLGYADYVYRNDQPATTLWYHDHSLGMTRLNVYAGPAGFWLIRGGIFDIALESFKIGRWTLLKPGRLPGPAPEAGQGVLALNNPADPVRQSIREIPIAIQDRTFKPDGSLFYPGNRAFFEGLNESDGTPAVLDIPFVPDSDIAPIWNPEAFFSVMVVNGVSWPELEVAPARYRFRLLNGCNSRFLNLSLFVVDPNTGDITTQELPFYQIGAEQGFLPKVAMISTGFATPLPGNGTIPTPVAAPSPQQGLLMALAERADVIVDFSGLPDGTIVRMINTAGDEPFGGFPTEPADPDTTGQVMEFVVNSALHNWKDAKTTPPENLVLVAEPSIHKSVDAVRQISLNEEESSVLCVEMLPDGSVVEVPGSTPPDCAAGGEPFGPKEALLGTVDLSGAVPEGIALKWTDTTGVSTPVNYTLQSGEVVSINVTENPTRGNTEDWEIYNFTADAHPIHLHLVRFEVLGRQSIDGSPSIVGNAPQPWESGFKDTVISYPGEITKVRATFDIAGLYVWHCHIVEHEDNEMMRPYVVSP